MRKTMSDMMTIMPVLAVKPWLIVMIVLIVVLVAAFVALTIYGKKRQAGVLPEGIRSGITEHEAFGYR